MSALSQRKSWYCVGLVPIERLVLFCCAQRGGARDLVLPVEFDKMARRCCIDDDALRAVLLSLHGKGHVTVQSKWIVLVHPKAPKEFDAMVVGSRAMRRKAMERLTKLA